jgi:hypothetical protein
MCARAIETIRVVMAPENINRKTGWALMQKHLNLNESFVKAITDCGVAPRHGDHKFVAGSTNRVIATRSWIIMNRFLVYKKRGSLPLPLAEFPLLVG